MSEKNSTRSKAGSHNGSSDGVSLRSRDVAGPPSRDRKRFDFFLVDTGWNAAVSKVVRTQLRSLFDVGGYHEHDHLYELSPQQSAVVLGRAPENIGCDPTIIVYDLYGSIQVRSGNYHGFRLNLGLMRHPEQALARLQELTRFIAIHRTAERLDREVRRELHREGFEGIVKVLRETSLEMLIE